MHSHRTKSLKRNTKHKPKDKKEEIKKRNNNLLMINNKLILYKKKPDDFGITYEIRKRINDVKKEIDFEHLESEILEKEKNVVTNKELNFAFAQPTN